MFSLAPNQDYRTDQSQTLHDDIVRYYDQAYWDYRTAWLNGENLAIHYGLWDSQTNSHSESLLNLNRFLATKAEVRSTDTILDAGCGVGGSSIWLAETFAAQITGITLSDKQVSIATHNASRRGVAERVNFKPMDFCETGFADGSFDLVWAIESVCHAVDKSAFIKEAHRVLRPGGRLIMSDGYAKKRDFTEHEWKVVETCLNGWAIPNLATVAEYRQYLEESQFTDIDFMDMTAKILPSAKRLRNTALITLPMQKIMETLKLRTRAQTGNFNTALNQYKIFREGMACYGIFYAQKAA